ncbi:MAG: hypothetical protein ACYC35_09775, partial [Pirellulales bacterium]
CFVPFCARSQRRRRDMLDKTPSPLAPGKTNKAHRFFKTPLLSRTATYGYNWCAMTLPWGR